MAFWSSLVDATTQLFTSPVAFVGEHFLFSAGLWALLALIPFLILYLIRPRPKHEAIPSLMFILSDMGKSNINSFLRNILRDLLFFIQLLIIVLLAFAAAKPYAEVARGSLAHDAVLIIDVSASMQANDRFDEVISTAKKNLGETNTIILVKHVPEVILEQGTASDAQARLETLEPSDTITNLYDAILTSTDYAGEGSRVVIISDFVNTAGGGDYETALNVLRSKGVVVDRIDVWVPAENVGIIDLDVQEEETTVWVKNFKQSPERATLRVSDTTSEILLGPRSTELVTFPTPPGVNEIILDVDDEFEPDNIAYLSAPERNEVDALIITNQQEPEKSFLSIALRLITRTTTTTIMADYLKPPQNVDVAEYELFILHRVNTSLLLPGTIKQIRERVRDEGATLIITAQDDIFSIDLGDLWPVSYAAHGEVRLNLEAPEKSLLTEDISFGQASYYLKATPNEGTTVLVRGDDDLQTPMVAFGRVGAGRVVYYGIFDQLATFPLDNTYPVFWKRLIDFVTDKPDVNNLNHPTGTQLSFARTMRIDTPTGEVESNFISLDQAGLYAFPDRIIAATLRSERESSVTERDDESAVDRVLEGETRTGPKELTSWFIIAALALLLCELAYLKYRGDV